ncbi:MAG TPA: penicillin-binding transpeptidase domain-containing protein [Gammaproteobacteria bacterium]|nr:penicillin-binding transpeptidase domain-containing protein [Gammaproteobacteria bacterium]
MGRADDKLQITLSSWRFYFLGLFILMVVAGLTIRAMDLAIVKRRFLQNQGDARSLRVITEPAFRGMITDRDGYPLAISASVFSVWINPKEFVMRSRSLQSLANLLGLKTKNIQTMLLQDKNKNREFVYIKRQVSPPIANALKSLKIKGVYLQQDYKRFYPEGEIAAHVIGFTNVDDQGQEGLELVYNDWLRGTPGKKRVIQDRTGRVIDDLQLLQQQKQGADLQLSLNRQIQYLAYRELLDGVKKNLAASGSVIVLDVKTGEILAMVNQPSFNPNNMTDQKKENFRNRSVTDIFEPGSTMKSFSVATALESGKYKSDTLIDTSPGWIHVGNHTLRDEHVKGIINLMQVLQYSSNVGMTKVILTLPPHQLWNFLHRMGFGEVTGVGFPGEQSGKMVNRPVWKPLALATLSFGYGISVTALQLAHAYATIANEGIKIPLSLVRVDQPPQGERVLDRKIALQMLDMLQSVLAKGGTGEPARVPGYSVAGKTGTAWISENKSYQKHRYTSSFVGIAPASHPRLVVAVVIHDPKGKQFLGGYVSGPVFEKIMEGSLRILNVPPDAA